MKTNLHEFNYQVSELSIQRANLKSQIQETFSQEISKGILGLTHTLNVEYDDHLKKIKEKKFQKLIEKKNQYPRNETHIKPVVTIPPDLDLSDAERNILSKGLKFVPTQQRVDHFQLGQDIEAFYRRLKLHAFFNDANRTLNGNQSDTPNEDNPYKKFQPKSTWTPREEPNPTVSTYIARCRAEIGDISNLPKLKTNNLSKAERDALKSLKQRNDIVIKPADKGGSIVVWQKELYLQEAERQLSNSEYYTKEEYDKTAENNKVLEETIREEIENGNLSKEATCLINPAPRTSKFYLVPKIHKPNNPGRPIVSACNCPTERVSSFVDSILQPLVTSLPSYTRDSSDTISKVKSFHANASDKVLIFTMDVKSLYTVIPHNDGLIALKHFLNKRPVLEPPTDTVLRLAELILTLNSFEFNSEFFKQRTGVAMGTKFGPSFANIFLGYLEEQMHTTYNGITPELYYRFIDDIFGITTMPLEDLNSWMDAMRSMHEAIEFTVEISESSVHFLDTTFTICEDNTIKTSVYFKPTDSHTYLRYSSFHPKATKDAIPYSQLVRLRRLTSDDSEFKERQKELLGYFQDRDYPLEVLQKAESKTQGLSQDRALETKERIVSDPKIPFVTSHHPHAAKVFKVLQKNWEVFQTDVTTTNLFKDPPMLSRRRGKNLKDILVRTSVTSEEELAGTYRCGRRQCNTCIHTYNGTTIAGPDATFHVKSSFSCTTKNVVYCILCINCGKLYLGETKRMLAERFREHLRDITKKKTTSPVAQHFNSAGHSIDDIVVCVLRQYENDAQRKEGEMRLIQRLGTLDPKGLNLDFSYNV